MLPDKELLRVDEVMRYFDVSRSTIYLWLAHGILAGEKYRGVIRIPRKSVIECRMNAKIEPRPEPKSAPPGKGTGKKAPKMKPKTGKGAGKKAKKVS